MSQVPKQKNKPLLIKFLNYKDHILDSSRISWHIDLPESRTALGKHIEQLRPIYIRWLYTMVNWNFPSL